MIQYSFVCVGLQNRYSRDGAVRVVYQDKSHETGKMHCIV